MGDDAELYMDMQEPWFWDMVERSNNYKKKNLILFIDAENVSVNCIPAIQQNIPEIGELYEARYYALQKNDSTNNWKIEGKKHGYKPILMCGGPQKNKIDNKIIKDAKKILADNKSIDIFCIASRDGDYTDLVNLLRENHKRVVILAPEETSKKLREAASETIYIPRQKCD